MSLKGIPEWEWGRSCENGGFVECIGVPHVQETGQKLHVQNFGSKRKHEALGDCKEGKGCGARAPNWGGWAEMEEDFSVPTSSA